MRPSPLAIDMVSTPAITGRRSCNSATASSTVINAEPTAKQSSLSWTIVPWIPKPREDQVQWHRARDDNLRYSRHVVQVHHRYICAWELSIARHCNYTLVVRMKRWLPDGFPKDFQLRMVFAFEPFHKHQI